MLKIPLSRNVYNPRGDAVKVNRPNPEWEALSDKEKKDTEIPQVIPTEQTIRDYLLNILSLKFKIEDKKEIFWITSLGIQFSTEEDEVEISDDKTKFLRRIIENNKFTQVGMGGVEKEIELFFPYEVSQILVVFLSVKEREEYGIEDVPEKKEKEEEKKEEKK